MKKKALHTRIIYLCCTLLLLVGSIQSIARTLTDTVVTSTHEQAIAYVESIKELAPSIHWPNVKPALFLQNLKNNIYKPLSLYEGNNTNFCSYAALSYIPLHNDPLGYVTWMMALYKQGKAQVGRVLLEPSPEVKRATGRLSFKGELDVRPADQMWFLCLADHFKGYLNFFDKHFDMGDENKMWAAVNFAKFNRMVRKLFNYQSTAVGSDLIRPRVNDIYTYLHEKLETGTVALFLNSLSLYKKNHSRQKIRIPTHFVILLKIEEVDDKINITYWDYGGLSMQQVTPAFLERIIYGISHFTKKQG